MPTSYYGLPTGRIENAHLTVEYLTTAGPRVARLFLAGSEQNLLAETPENGWDTPFGYYRLYGGHRLWIAPERAPDTSFPDNDPVTVEPLADGVKLTQRPESLSGLVKSIELHLASAAAQLMLVHGVRNQGEAPRELALWAITELPLGGRALFPCPNELRADMPLAPNRQLTLWPCSRWTDTRLELQDDLIIVRGEAGLPPYKAGYFASRGKIAYWLRDVLLVKSFAPEPSRPYPDLNCNAEVYVNDQYLELETLGPLVRLAPGETAFHTETWTLYQGMADADSVRTLLE